MYLQNHSTCVVWCVHCAFSGKKKWFSSCSNSYRQPRHITLYRQMRNKRKSTMKGNWNTLKCAWKASLISTLHSLHTCNNHTFQWTDARANIAPSIMKYIYLYTHTYTQSRHTHTHIHKSSDMGTESANDLLKEKPVHECNNAVNMWTMNGCTVHTAHCRIVYVSASTTNPYECTNMKAFPSENVIWNWLCVAYDADTLHNRPKKKKKEMQSDVFFDYKNAVRYADKLKRNASSIIYELIRMTKGLEFRWCNNKIIIVFVGDIWPDIHISFNESFHRLIYSLYAECFCPLYSLHLASTKTTKIPCIKKKWNMVCAEANTSVSSNRIQKSTSIFPQMQYPSTIKYSTSTQSTMSTKYVFRFT